jgi:uncharacterized protein
MDTTDGSTPVHDAERERLAGIDWILTYTGRRFSPLAPRPEDVCIEDIAHALANKCRFTGHTQRFYSVAEHSVLVQSLVSPPYGLAALLHDAAEAYLPDIASPIKRSVFVDAGKASGYSPPFAWVEAAVTKAIFEGLGYGPLLAAATSEVVKAADLKALWLEVHQLMSSSDGFSLTVEGPANWQLPSRRDPVQAEEYFLNAFKALT